MLIPGGGLLRYLAVRQLFSFCFQVALRYLPLIVQICFEAQKNSDETLELLQQLLEVFQSIVGALRVDSVAKHDKVRPI